VVQSVIESWSKMLTNSGLNRNHYMVQIAIMALCLLPATRLG